MRKLQILNQKNNEKMKLFHNKQSISLKIVSIIFYIVEHNKNNKKVLLFKIKNRNRNNKNKISLLVFSLITLSINKHPIRGKSSLEILAHYR